MRISDWSSDVCSSDLVAAAGAAIGVKAHDVAAGIADDDEFPVVARAAVQRPIVGLIVAVGIVAEQPAVFPAHVIDAVVSSEESRGGKECVRTCRARGSPYH